MDIEEFRRAGYRAIDDICDYFYSLRDMPVAPQVEPGYLRRALPLTAPQTGEVFEKITEDYHNLIVPGLMHWQHPRFLGYFPAHSTFAAILGDLYANGIGCNPGFNWSVGPACTELEMVVMDWAARMLGLGTGFHNSSEEGGGVIQTTASESALVAAVAARSRFMRRHPSVPAEKLVLYTTTQTHSLGKKAGLVLGLTVRALEVTAEDRYALRGETLRRALEQDIQAGLHPFMLIATIGTTSSGAMDHIGELGKVVAAVPSLWLHVDAAWAGMFMVCPEYRDICFLDDINRYADSFCTNFHKMGLVNVGCSALWVRERKNLTDALDVTPEFLRSKHGDAGTVIDYRNWNLGLSRRFQSLKLWFVMRTYGVQGFQQYIRQAVHQGDVFSSLVQRSAYFKLVTPPSLSLSVFRLEPRLYPDTTSTNVPSDDSDLRHPCHAGGVEVEKTGYTSRRNRCLSSTLTRTTRLQQYSRRRNSVAVSRLSTTIEPSLAEHKYKSNPQLEELNALNRAFHARLSARHDVVFTQTDLNGIICIRCAVGAERTEETDILRVFEVLCEEADRTLHAWDWNGFKVKEGLRWERQSWEKVEETRNGLVEGVDGDEREMESS